MDQLDPNEAAFAKRRLTENSVVCDAMQCNYIAAQKMVPAEWVLFRCKPGHGSVKFPVTVKVQLQRRALAVFTPRRRSAVLADPPAGAFLSGDVRNWRKGKG
ncbi:MAG: hypothetical protein ACT4O2_16680 [Beijerinckiaceae bacterium]